MCKMSDSISNLAASLVKFNAEVKRIEKDGNNPQFRSKYATLDGVVDDIRPILQKHGLSVMQFPGKDGDDVTVKTMLLHESGEWLESETSAARPVKNDPQGVGSAITYLRRYSLTAFLSLSTGDIDDDGNAASQPPAQPQQHARTTSQTTQQHSQAHDNVQNERSQQQSVPKPATEAQVRMIRAKMNAAGMELAQVNQFLRLSLESITELPIAKVNELIKYLDENRLPA